MKKLVVFRGKHEYFNKHGYINISKVVIMSIVNWQVTCNACVLSGMLRIMRSEGVLYKCADRKRYPTIFNLFYV